MIVGVDQGRNHERPPRRRGRGGFVDGGDDAAVVPQHDIPKQAVVGTTKQRVSRDFGGHECGGLSRACGSADAPVASWFETRGVAALLTMRVDLILRSALLRASRRMCP